MIDPVTFLDEVLVEHAGFQSAVTRIDSFMRSGRQLAEPVGIAVLGLSGSGKSRVLETVYKKYPQKREDDGLSTPIVRISVPSMPTVRSLAYHILKELDPGEHLKATEDQMTMRIRVLMKHCGTQMIMLDEFQHFYDKHSHKVWHRVADWLKVLIDSTKCVLVVAGLPECTAVIAQNHQLSRRFRAPQVLPQFLWTDATGRREFQACVKCFEKVIQPYLPIPQLLERDWNFRIWCATGGLMGYLKSFLTELLMYASETGKTHLVMGDFDTAHSRYLYSYATGTETLRPFSSNFRLELTAQVSEAARAFGTSPLALLDRHDSKSIAR
jgi:Bacterial TniB protein